MKAETAAQQNIRRITAFGLMPPYENCQHPVGRNSKAYCAVMFSTRMDHAPFKPAENIRRITASGLMPPYAGYAGGAIT